MIGHQAVRVTQPSEAVTNPSQGRQELPAFIVGEENVMPFVDSGRDVVQSTRELFTKGSGHGVRYKVIPVSRRNLTPLEGVCNGRPD